MSERGNFRGRSGGVGGSGGGGGRDRGNAGQRGGRGGGHAGQAGEKPKKENILDLTKYMDKEIAVKFNGGREGEWPCFYGSKCRSDWGAVCNRLMLGSFGLEQLPGL